VASLTFQGIVQKIKTHPRPLVLHFVQVRSASPIAPLENWTANTRDVFVQYTDARINGGVEIHERKVDDAEEERTYGNAGRNTTTPTSGDTSFAGEELSASAASHPHSSAGGSREPDSPTGEGTEDTFI
jgi:hypothetical protein